MMHEYLSEVEVKNRLKTLTIVCDTREQVNDHIIRYFDSKGIDHTSRKLDGGDYSAMIGGKTLEHSVVIERKHSIDEIAGNFTADRDRFEKEFLRCSHHGTKVYLLIEDCSWEDIFAHNYSSKTSPQSLIGSLMSWQTRYNITVIFCKKATSGKVIHGILHYFAKEVLEYGNR